MQGRSVTVIGDGLQSLHIQPITLNFAACDPTPNYKSKNQQEKHSFGSWLVSSGA